MNYDVIVIGGGSGGLTCALGAINLNKTVLLIERNLLGGECTWSGCVPSKAFIQYSKEIDPKEKDLIFKKVRDISEHIYHHESPQVLTSHGIDVIKGEASFVDEHTLVVNDTQYHGKEIVICTGSSPAVPPISGLQDILTNDSFFLQDKLPKSIVFIGAGVISVELSIPLARLGVEVTILEKSPIFLPMIDKTSREFIKDILKNYNIDLITDIDIQKVENNHDNTYTVSCDAGQIIGEKIFVATGRKPNIDKLNLEVAGVEFTNQGVIVDEHLCTSKSHIYAVGDVVANSPRFSHVAGMQGKTVVHNIANPTSKKIYEVGEVPFIIFTEPEYSQVGLSETQAKEKYGNEIKIYRYFQEDCERAIMGLDKYFYIKVIAHQGFVVGASVMGTKGGELANILQYFYASNTPLKSLATIIQPYPTYGDFLRRVARIISEDI